MLFRSELQRLGQPRVIKPITPPPPLYDWLSMPFPKFEAIATVPVKTRREELEEYTDGQIRELYNEKKAKELTKYRINYILEAEKEYK